MSQLLNEQKKNNFKTRSKRCVNSYMSGMTNKFQYYVYSSESTINLFWQRFDFVRNKLETESVEKIQSMSLVNSSPIICYQDRMDDFFINKYKQTKHNEAKTTTINNVLDEIH